jgi:hypothetical protein
MSGVGVIQGGDHDEKTILLGINGQSRLHSTQFSQTREVFPRCEVRHELITQGEPTISLTFSTSCSPRPLSRSLLQVTTASSPLQPPLASLRTSSPLLVHAPLSLTSDLSFCHSCPSTSIGHRIDGIIVLSVAYDINDLSSSSMTDGLCVVFG